MMNESLISITANIDQIGSEKLQPAEPTQTNAAIFVALLASPLGELFAAASDDGICLLEFTNRRILDTQLNRLKKLKRLDFVAGIHSYFYPLRQQLSEYFSGTRTGFDLPLDLCGTEFQTGAWKALLTVPYGETRSYQQQAATVGKPNAVRAIAKANGDNRISIIVPCHRLIGKDGSLTGYGGGLWRKQKLLELESSTTASDCAIPD